MTNPTAAEVFLMVDNNNISRSDDFWNIDIINTNALTFENSPILMKTICDIIVEKKNNGFTEIIFNHLPSWFRNKLYRVLSYLDISFQKNRFNGQTDILIDISNCFQISNFGVENIRSPTKRRLLYNFYNNLNLDTNQDFENFNITSQQYITYCTIMNNYYGDNYTDNYTNNNNTNYNNINNNRDYYFINNNNNIKMELSNLIFDIKDDITDIMFKNLMDKLAELKF